MPFVPRSWSDGEVPDAPMLNLEIRDKMLALAPAKVLAAGDLVYADAAESLVRLPAGRSRATLAVHPTLPQPYWLDELVPWLLEFWPYDGWVGNTNWSTRTSKGDAFHYGQVVSTNVQNGEIWWYGTMGKGTWTCSLDLDLSGNTLSHGIVSVRLDDAEVATYDQYNAPVQAYGTRVQLPGIVVAATGRKKIGFKVAAKNAASGGYYCGLSHVTWLRTA